MTLDDLEILLVEDEIIIGFALDDMIAEQGARTRLVTSMAEATETLEGAQFDLAILDVNLHGELTYPLADKLAERNCPFIFATGYGTVVHPERFSDIPTISKPYDLPSIFEALQKARGG